ncbi:hypothetical protein BRADI_3g00449v3 [Brachypodium distachyon]|uniref:Uncharacterized protein n=1 Tax=Brachypodium distachyon TaxID=15368 RepID=A0A2K2CUF3_BRADI|nr:hypothetical protein BRADI_3g00449v3 [Brachypodium distachyon]
MNIAILNFTFHLITSELFSTENWWNSLKEGPKLSLLVTEIQGAPRKRYSSLPRSKYRARSRTEEPFYENPFPDCICLSGKHLCVAV